MSELRGQLQESYSNSTHSCPTHALMFTLAIDPITAFGSRGISPRKGSDRLVSYSHSTAHPKGSPLGVHDPKDATSRGTTKSRSASGGRRAGPRLLRSLNSGLHRREQTFTRAGYPSQLPALLFIIPEGPTGRNGPFLSVLESGVGFVVWDPRRRFLIEV